MTDPTPQPELPADVPPSVQTQPTPAPATPTPPPRSRFRRWGRRLLKLTFVLFVLLVVAAVGVRTTYRVIGNRELAAATAKLDAEEPGWRLPDLQSAREKERPPENENASAVVARVRAAIPNSWLFGYEFRPKPDPEEQSPRNHRRHPDELLGGPHELEEFRFRAWERLSGLAAEEPATLDHLVESTAQARALGLTLRKMPRGYRAVEFSDNPLEVDPAPLEGVRKVTALMLDDALLAAHANDPIRGLRAAHAALNAGRSLGDEPWLVSQLVRMACGSMAAESAVRVLALCDPKLQTAELGELQAALAAEAEQPLLLYAIRGDRAVMHLALENTANGKLEAHILAHGGTKEERSVSDRLMNWFIRGFHPGGHAKYLELMSKAVAAAKLPPHEQVAALSEVEQEMRAIRSERFGLGYRLTMLITPAEKLADSTLRHRAALLTTATGIACERFRLARGRWPNSLDEIPKDILAAVPPDPYTGKPLTLTKLKDGIAVTSVGSGKQGRGIGGDKPDTGPLGGSDIGCRLYDPVHRGLPPIPRKPKVDPFAPANPDDEDKE